MRNMQTIFQPNGSQTIATSTTVPAPATAINGETYAVRLYATTDTYFSFEKVADKTTCPLLAAGMPEKFAIQNGAVISLLADTTAGKVNITELST